MKRSEVDIPITYETSSKRKRKKAALKEFRRAVLARAEVPGGWKCERCLKVFRNASDIEAHHKVPRSQGGSNCVTNGHALCRVFVEEGANCHVGTHLHINEEGKLPWWDFIVVRNPLGKAASEETA